MARAAVVRVGDLLREPGSRRVIERSVDLGPLATSAASTVPGSSLDVVGVAMGIAGGVELSGTVRFDWSGPCRRCLEEVSGSIAVDFREICQREPVDDEIFPIADDLADLEPLIRELVLSSLPLAPLCSLDCAGPDPERFPASTDTGAVPGAVPGADADPRWAALSELRFDDSTED